MKLSAALAVVLIGSCLPATAQQGGAALYAQRCAQCHDSTDANIRAPSRAALQSRSFDEVLGAITTGPMASFAQGLSNDERAAIASLVTGKAASHAAAENPGQCAQGEAGFPQPIDGPRWNGWGADLNNSRFQPAAMAGLTQEQVSRLRLKWAFGFPGASIAFAQPTVIGGLLFVGGTDRKVHALDARTGCTRWVFPTEAPVRAAINFATMDNGQPVVFFGDLLANIYAVNAMTGTPIWKTRIEDHLAARITGAPVFYSGVVYVGVSSIEEAIGSRPTYQCCTFRGSVVALKAETGAQVWKTYTIAEAPHPTRTNAIGTQLFGPAGASVWSAPTIDVQRKALYVATSNSYADPATDTSDAVLAFDLETGKMLWHQQATPKDSFVVACFGTDQSNCPEDPGPDHDFGQSPILVNLRDGHRALVIGQKSGVVHALDPDHEGKILWQTRIGQGGPLGGTEWGSAADQDRIYVANSDVRFLKDGSRRLNSSEGGGLFGLDLATGKIAMQVAPVACGDRPQCSPALSAAVTAIPGVVFSGGVSGFLRAYATDDAKLLWEIDTAREYTTVNGVPGHGGAMDGPGPIVVDGMLYVNSGYAQWGGLPGNVLLAFEVGNP
ncbi:PQQ-binding-like beta-propeller repeat protein [Bradyrhizobium sp. CER78]|uniref:outer membrane protein assembly factor BamB family protein n=1 Tax=Bradyrhizobium sp. CER78 TaxID=3039162 RepID=UPI002448BB79|nr:PQQ-binding-like beta-propeller repeat protein [Bradyrhizobium sp. CER78]MDH2385313.1 PQQ-binding-like beta-propeller repeat protein [Bradyrhizobium sp. CER78]